MATEAMVAEQKLRSPPPTSKGNVLKVDVCVPELLSPKTEFDMATEAMVAEQKRRKRMDERRSAARAFPPEPWTLNPGP